MCNGEQVEKGRSEFFDCEQRTGNTHKAEGTTEIEQIQAAGQKS